MHVVKQSVVVGTVTLQPVYTWQIIPFRHALVRDQRFLRESRNGSGGDLASLKRLHASYQTFFFHTQRNMAPLLSVKGLTLRRDDGEGSAILNVC